MELARQSAVVLRDLRTGATAARVAEECEVLTAQESRRVVKHRELAELDEVIAAPTRAELCPGTILQVRGQTCHPPIGVHDLVLPARSERGADPEAGLALEHARQTCLVVLQCAYRQVQYRQLHPARDVDADRIRDHCVTGGQHATDWQP